jgi:glycosylphosphatidylinositol deacylase
MYTFLFSQLGAIYRPSENAGQRPIQRILTILSLSLLVVIFVPHQFVYLLLTLVHLHTTARSLLLARSHHPNHLQWSRYRYFLTVLVMLVWLLPSNGPILLVWLRNLQAGYYAPFSDRNVFSVGGLLLWSEAVHADTMLPRTNSRCVEWSL